MQNRTSSFNEARLNLICLPFAGGSRYSYRKFERVTPAFLNLVTLEYPGRGMRMKEPLLTTTDLLVEDLFSQAEHLFDRPYAIFGHSMGGLLSFLLSRKIVKLGRNPPAHLFITGTPGPSTFVDPKRHYLLEKSAFLKKIRELHSGLDEIMCNDEVLDYFEPVLRADFQAYETYMHAGLPPLNIPFTLITGTEEGLQEEDILAWQRETRWKVDFNRMPGNHFFIFEHTGKIMEVIYRKLYSTFSNLSL